MNKNFICLEGIDGCGKSTQITMLEDFFKNKGMEVLKIREPGGTEISESVRQILLNPQYKGKMNNIAELLLYNAARAQLIHEVIKPALQKGVVVLADRFAYSTLAYQGYGRELDIGMIKDLLKITCGEFFPSKTFILDIEVPVSRERQRKDFARNGADRIEQEKDAFFERVRQGYISIAKENPEHCILIDAADSAENIFEIIKEASEGLEK